MIRAINRIRLPLLVKDLTEAAARKRTYIVRVLFIVVASLFFLGLYKNIVDRADRDIQRAFGRGQDIAEFLMVSMLVGVYVLLPAAMSASLTREKEGGTLSLLLITDLGAGEIVLQKLLAGLVPLLTTFALLLPFAGLAYTLGGVGPGMLLVGSLVVLVACMQVGATALLASVWSRTSVGAFIVAYAFLVLIMFGTFPFLMLADGVDLMRVDQIGRAHV